MNPELANTDSLANHVVSKIPHLCLPYARVKGGLSFCLASVCIWDI